MNARQAARRDHQENLECANAMDDQFTERLRESIREHLSPNAVATIIAFLQPAAMHRAPTPDATSALVEVEWFTDFLTDLIGTQECDRLFEELGL